jgi:hypothetical protein
MARSLITSLDTLRDAKAATPQLIVATHAPVVLASIEPLLSPGLDALFHLHVVGGNVVLDRNGGPVPRTRAPGGLAPSLGGSCA